MKTSQERKTHGGKDDRDRGDHAKRRLSAFYWRSDCCNAHVTQPAGEECWACTKCEKICKVTKP
jgi:hypothetical protein